MSNVATSQVAGSIRDIVHDQIAQNLINPKEMKCMYDLAFIWNESSSGLCKENLLAKVVAKHESNGIQVHIEWAMTILSGKKVDIQRVKMGMTTTMLQFTWTDYEECLFRVIIDHEKSEWRWYVLSGYYDGDVLEKKDIRLQITKVSADATTTDLPVNQLN